MTISLYNIYNWCRVVKNFRILLEMDTTSVAVCKVHGRSLKTRVSLSRQRTDPASIATITSCVLKTCLADLWDTIVKQVSSRHSSWGTETAVLIMVIKLLTLISKFLQYFSDLIPPLIIVVSRFDDPLVPIRLETIFVDSLLFASYVASCNVSLPQSPFWSSDYRTSPVFERSRVRSQQLSLRIQ
jgi:hypothetical protein